MSDMFDVQGRSYLITGATGALGSATARSLSEAGAHLTLAGGNAEALAQLASELPSARTVTVARRPETPEDAAAMVDAAVEAFGALDGVVISSGMNKVAPIIEMDIATWESVMDANVKGSWLVCQAAGRVMLPRKKGSVVLISSARGKLGHPNGYSAYSPSKAAVDLLAKTLAAEWGPSGIRVNAIGPTVFRSDLTAWMYADDDNSRAVREAFLARIPLKRLSEPSDLVGPIQFLLSDASVFVTGAVLYADGGYTAC